MEKMSPQTEKLLAHPLNKRITFTEAGHFYTYTNDDGKKERWSGITSLIKKYEPYKDFKKIAAGTAAKLTRETGRKHTADMVLAMWRSQTDRGTQIHNILETWIMDGTFEPQNAWFIHELQYYCELYDLVPVASEFVICNPEISIASMVDILCYRKSTGKLVVVDTKTMKEDNIFRQYSETFAFPIMHLQTSKFNKFSIQVQFYVDWLKNVYGADVDDEHYVMHMNDHTVKMLVVRELKQEISDVTEHYKKFHLPPWN